MKTLSESINENNQINESIVGGIGLFMTCFGVSVLVGILVGIFNADMMLKSIDEPGVIDQIKLIWASKKAKKIIERIAQDPEVQDFFKQSYSKQQTGWRKLISSKLDEKELKYLKKITKDNVRFEIHKQNK